MANTFRVTEFRQNTGLAYVVVALLLAIAFLSAMYAIFGFVMITAPDWVIDFGDGEAPLSVAVGVIGLFALLEFPLRLILIVTFLIWIYRAYSNLSPLRATHLDSSPGWAVGWWFIPFANLVRPFQVVRELFNESTLDSDPDSPFSIPPPGTPLEVGAWWAAFLLSGFASRISDGMFGDVNRPASQYAWTAFIAAALLTLIAALLAAYIVKTVNAGQVDRLAMIEATNARIMDQPPAPPIFDRDL